MSVLRQGNWLGQQRVDLPHLRAIESGAAADFDVLAGLMLAGGESLVLRGFTLNSTAVGRPATSLELDVAEGLILHYEGSVSGTLLWVPSTRAPETLSTTNSRVSGSFSVGTNYLGLDFSRQADDTTADVAQFLSASTLIETARTVPMARTLDYTLVVDTTLDFASRPNILPLAKIVVDGNGNVTSVVDARQLMFRLGSGGDNPDIQHAYPWPGTRAENTSGDVFAGGDKSIGSLKDGLDALMTRCWELGGGEYWYSATADRNVTLIWTGSPFSSGENLEWDGTNLHWKGLRFVFDNSTGWYNDVVDQETDLPGLTDLADGDCVYVDLIRTNNDTPTAVKSPMVTMGAPTVPGSRYVIAWRNGSEIFTRNTRFPLGAATLAATTSSLGTVKLNQTPADGAHPQVVSIMTGGGIVVAASTGTGADFSSSSGVGLIARANATRGAVNVAVVTSDPASPSDGDLWYLNTSGVRSLKMREDGVTYTLSEPNTTTLVAAGYEIIEGDDSWEPLNDDVGYDWTYAANGKKLVHLRGAIWDTAAAAFNPNIHLTFLPAGLHPTLVSKFFTVPLLNDGDTYPTKTTTIEITTAGALIVRPTASLGGTDATIWLDGISFFV